MFYDINKNPIVHNEFNINDNIRTIEIGAGVSNFSKMLYQNCYTTDIKTPVNLNHFRSVNCTTQPCHFVDFDCDIYTYDFNDKMFDRVIICNPYGYGFKDNNEGVQLINTLGRILNNNGIIQIITTKKNGFTNKIHRLIYGPMSEGIKYKFNIISKTTIDPTVNVNYFSQIKYTQCEYDMPTQPNEEIILSKIA